MRVLVGEPVEVADIMEAARVGAWSEQRLDRALADRIAQSLVSLKVSSITMAPLWVTLSAIICSKFCKLSQRAMITKIQARSVKCPQAIFPLLCSVSQTSVLSCHFSTKRAGAAQARLDGREEVVAPPAEAMSRLVEDELDAAGHPWGLSLRQRAGIPSSVPGAFTGASTAGLSIMSPMDIAAAAMAPSGRKPLQPVRKEQHLWPLLQGLQSVLAAAGIPGAGYSQLRTTAVAAMLRPAC